MSAFKDKKVFVTGATGFIGGRLVERLIGEGAEIVALVRNFTRAPRLARYPVTMVPGDVLDADSIRNAIKGCDYVVHCAVSFVGSSKEQVDVTVEGTRNLCEAAAEAGVKGFVHMGTISSYGDPPDGPLSEESAKKPKGLYGKAKLAADGVVREAARVGLPAIILEPTIVFGPWSFWSSYPFMQTAKGRAVLPREGDGLCNAVYVDDVVAAILLGLQAEKGFGNNYLITGDEPVSWREFFSLHLGEGAEEKLRLMATKAVEKKLSREKWVEPFLGMKSRLRSDRVLRRELLGLPGIREATGLALKVVPAVQDRLMGRSPGERRAIKVPVAPGPVDPPDVFPVEEHLEILRSRVEVKNDRAKAELGFRPAWTVERGVEMTRRWLEWANIT